MGIRISVCDIVDSKTLDYVGWGGLTLGELIYRLF